MTGSTKKKTDSIRFLSPEETVWESEARAPESFEDKEDVLGLITHEHRMISLLFDYVNAQTDPQGKWTAFQDLLQELTVHELAEKKALYLLLENQKPSLIENVEMVSEEITRYSIELFKLDPREEDWTLKFEELRDFLEQHMDDEEQIYFAEIKEVLSEHCLVNAASVFEIEREKCYLQTV